MKERPLRTTVDRQLSVPRLARARLAPPRRVRARRTAPSSQDDAVIAAIHDQVRGRPRRHHRRRADAARLQPVLLRPPRGHRRGGGLAAPLRPARPRPARAPSRDRRARAPRGPRAWWRSSSACGALAPPGPALKASVPGPYTLSGRLAAERALPRPLGPHRGAAAHRRASSSRRWSPPAAARSASTSRR